MADTVDFHAHILPIDHGSDSVDMALRQLELAKKNGVDIVCATPHFYPHEMHVEGFLERRGRAFERVSERLTPELPKIIPGAEVLFCENIEKMQGFEMLALNSKSYILLEMPFGQWRQEWIDNLLEIKSILNGKLVLAHVDRYDPHYIDLLFEHDFHGQLNAGSVGLFGVNKKHREWIKNGNIVAIGSDIHLDKSKYYENFSKMRKSLGSDFDDVMERTNRILSEE